jgi:hypothetical protein
MCKDHQQPEFIFLPLSRRLQGRLPDAEYIERVRKSVRWWDRWRWAGVALYLVIIATIIWLAFRLVDLLRALQAPVLLQNAQIEAIVLIGIIAGLHLGFIAHSAIWGVIQALAGLRNERLLIQYHDRLGELLDNNGANASSTCHYGVDHSRAAATGIR